MTESREEQHPDEKKPATSEGEVPAQADTGHEGKAEFGEDRGPAEADTPGEPEVLPDVGGYAGRDPKTDMPRIPTVPETQDDPHSHDAAPPAEGEDPPASH